MPIALSTTRLTIEPLAVGDIDDFVAYRRDPDVARWQSWDVTYGRDDAERLVAEQADDLPDPGQWLQLAVHRAGDLVGDVAVHRSPDQPDTFEIGMTIARPFQGRGFATESVGRVVAHLFDVAGAHRVFGTCDTRNAPVASLFKRLGFRHESRQVEADWFKGEWTTVDGYATLAGETRPGGPTARR